MLIVLKYAVISVSFLHDLYFLFLSLSYIYIVFFLYEQGLFVDRNKRDLQIMEVYVFSGFATSFYSSVGLFLSLRITDINMHS